MYYFTHHITFQPKKQMIPLLFIGVINNFLFAYTVNHADQINICMQCDSYFPDLRYLLLHLISLENFCKWYIYGSRYHFFPSPILKIVHICPDSICSELLLPELLLLIKWAERVCRLSLYFFLLVIWPPVDNTAYRSGCRPLVPTYSPGYCWY